MINLMITFIRHCQNFSADLLAMIEKLRKSLDSEGFGWWEGGGVASAALLADLSKTFDCLLSAA